MSHQHDIKDIFYLSPRDRKAALISVSVIGILMIVNILLNKQKNTNYLTPEEVEQLINDYVDRQKYDTSISTSSQTIQNKSRDKASNFSSKESITSPKIKAAIDPNTASKEELLNFGLSEFAARNLVNYRNKGAIFDALPDLFRIYGIDSQYVQAYAEFLIFPPPRVQSSKFENPEEYPTKQDSNKFYSEQMNHALSYEVHKEIKPINLNQATIESLQTIKGIGPSYSKRIIDYREKLGGYYSIEQLREVWNLPEETFIATVPYLYIDTSTLLLKKISVDQSSFKELMRHPYIDYEMAKVLKNIHPLRMSSGLDSLYQKGVISDSLWRYLH